MRSRPESCSSAISYNGRFSDLDIQVRDKFNNVIATSTAGLDSNNVETLIIPAVAGEAYFVRVLAEPGQVPPINVYDLDIINTPAPTPFGLVLAAGSDTGSDPLDNITNQTMPDDLARCRSQSARVARASRPTTGPATLADDAPGYKVEIYRNGTRRLDALLRWLDSRESSRLRSPRLSPKD